MAIDTMRCDVELSISYTFAKTPGLIVSKIELSSQPRWPKTNKVVSSSESNPIPIFQQKLFPKKIFVPYCLYESHQGDSLVTYMGQGHTCDLPIKNLKTVNLGLSISLSLGKNSNLIYSLVYDRKSLMKTGSHQQCNEPWQTLPS